MEKKLLFASFACVLSLNILCSCDQELLDAINNGINNTNGTTNSGNTNGNGNNSGGNTNGGNNSSGNGSSTNNKTKDYLYVTKVTCYKESGESDNLYIYKKNGGSEIRASWVYSAKGLDLAATEKVRNANKSVNGTYYKYYICPYGISWYFNY